MAGDQPDPRAVHQRRPGAILRGEQREFCRTWPNQTGVTAGGVHFIQEDSADAIGEAVASWLPG